MKGFLLLITGAVVVTTGYLARQLYLLYNAAFKVEKVKVNNVSVSNISMVLIAEIDSKSDISAIVKNQHYEVFFNNSPVSVINSPEDIHINSNGKTVFPISISFAPDKVVKTGITNLLALFLDRSSISIEIKGYLSIKAGAISMNNFPIYVKYTLQELIDMSKSEKK